MGKYHSCCFCVCVVVVGGGKPDKCNKVVNWIETQVCRHYVPSRPATDVKSHWPSFEFSTVFRKLVTTTGCWCTPQELVLLNIFGTMGGFRVSLFLIFLFSPLSSLATPLHLSLLSSPSFLSLPFHSLLLPSFFFYQPFFSHFRCLLSLFLCHSHSTLNHSRGQAGHMQLGYQGSSLQASYTYLKHRRSSLPLISSFFLHIPLSPRAHHCFLLGSLNLLQCQ